MLDARNDRMLVFGGYDSERLPANRWRLYNAAFYMAPSGALVERYYKHKLLLFGEYVPLSDRFPALLDLLPTPGEFTPGPGPGIFTIGGVRMAPLICYELLFPRVVRASLRAGGQVLVNLTNDYWFGKHLEPLQHLELARMCAIETCRPIVCAVATMSASMPPVRSRSRRSRPLQYPRPRSRSADAEAVRQGCAAASWPQQQACQAG